MKSNIISGFCFGLTSSFFGIMAGFNSLIGKYVISPFGEVMAMIGMGYEAYNHLAKDETDCSGYLVASVGLGLAGLEKLIVDVPYSKQLGILELAASGINLLGYAIEKIIPEKEKPAVESFESTYPTSPF